MLCRLVNKYTLPHLCIRLNIIHKTKFTCAKVIIRRRSFKTHRYCEPKGRGSLPIMKNDCFQSGDYHAYSSLSGLLRSYWRIKINMVLSIQPSLPARVVQAGESKGRGSLHILIVMRARRAWQSPYYEKLLLPIRRLPRSIVPRDSFARNDE